MSHETFSPTIHTVDALSDSIESLPDEFVLVGSIGRCALMGELKSLRRVNGTPTDLDVIDMTGVKTAINVDSPGMFRIDAGMTKLFRPVEDAWGLFLPGQSEPFSLIDSELCQPEVIDIPWSKTGSVKVEPLAIQSRLIDVVAPYYKNKQHIQKFRDLASSNPETLPADVQKTFEDFKAISWHINKYGTLDNPYSKSERAYRSIRRIFLMHSPPAVQSAVYRIVGSTVRSVRGTTTA